MYWGHNNCLYMTNLLYLATIPLIRSLSDPGLEIVAHVKFLACYKHAHSFCVELWLDAEVFGYLFWLTKSFEIVGRKSLLMCRILL